MLKSCKSSPQDYRPTEIYNFCMSYNKIVVAEIEKYEEMKISGDIPSKERDAIKEYHDWILTAYRGRRIVVREMARKVNNGTLKPSHLADMSKQIDEANKQLAYAKNGIKEVAGQMSISLER